MPNEVTIDRQTLADVISSLKSLDVRGWDSMNTLVGCVIVLGKAFYSDEKEVVNDG